MSPENIMQAKQIGMCIHFPRIHSASNFQRRWNFWQAVGWQRVKGRGSMEGMGTEAVKQGWGSGSNEAIHLPCHPHLQKPGSQPSSETPKILRDAQDSTHQSSHATLGSSTLQPAQLVKGLNNAILSAVTPFYD